MLSQSDRITRYLDDVGALLYSLPRQPIHDITEAILAAYRDSRTIYIIGNGGSASTATHFACDLQKWTVRPGRPRLKAVALTDNMALFSAWANDDGYEQVFAEQLRTLLNPGDLVIAISCSGRSPNVLNAIRYAASSGAVTVGMTGYSGGELVDLVDHCVVVRSERINQVEDVHMTICHLLADVVRSTMTQEDSGVLLAREAGGQYEAVIEASSSMPEATLRAGKLRTTVE